MGRYAYSLHTAHGLYTHTHTYTRARVQARVGRRCWSPLTLALLCYSSASAPHTPLHLLTHTNSAVTWGGRREAALIIIPRQAKFDKRPLFPPPHPLHNLTHSPSLLFLSSFTLWPISVVFIHRDLLPLSSSSSSTIFEIKHRL